MPTKFISFLGTTPYETCSYYFEDAQAEYYLTRFVQVSLIRHLVLTEKLDEYSQILILVTNEAKQRNWQDSVDREGNPLAGLETYLQQLQKHLEQQGKKLPPYRLVEIPEGKAEAELWTIFNKIAGLVEESDRVYFDITHSFRSLPMLALVALNYLRVVRKITIEKIYYGAFETLGTLKEVKQLPIEQRHARVFDLTPFVNLFEWTTAADHFVRTGNTFLLADLTRRDSQPLIESMPDSRKGKHQLTHLSDQLQQFMNSLLAARGTVISQFSYDLKKAIGKARQSVEALPPLANLFDQIATEFKDVNKPGEVITNTNIIIEYLLNHGLLQQALTLLDENIISFACLCCDFDYRHSKTRQVVTTALGIINRKVASDQWNLKSDGWMPRTLQEKIINTVIGKNLKSIAKLRSQTKKLRDTINHAGFNNAKAEYYDFLEEGKKSLSEFIIEIDSRKVD